MTKDNEIRIQLPPIEGMEEDDAEDLRVEKAERKKRQVDRGGFRGV